jgi:GNAT superfamily N-acetyltransferase
VTTVVRAGRPDEAEALAALAVRSKGHWRYPAAFLDRFARTHGLTAEVVAANDVRVLERDGRVRGFSTVLRRGPVAVLDDLWLDPDEIGRGSGRVLFEDAASRARVAGASTMEWEAEPGAVGFYERMGGIGTGWATSPLGRPLPRMSLALDTIGAPSSSPTASRAC